MQVKLNSGWSFEPVFRNVRFRVFGRMAAVRWALGIGMLLAAGLTAAAQRDANGKVTVAGELKQWHKVTLTVDGPRARETDNDPNPFTDYRMTVTFRHQSGSPVYVVPGYFAADGDAAHSSADAGTKWRAHLSPDKAGRWTYEVAFVRGKQVAVTETAPAESVAGCNGLSGTFLIGPTDKTGRDFRGKGRLQYVGRHHLRFAGNGEYFLKAGADAPENLLAYRQFDGDFKNDGHKDHFVKDWKPHVKDWRPGDPSWQDGKGKGIIGAVNYLASKGLNAMSFLTMNIRGDDQNVFPYVAYDDYTHLDVSRLDQWEVVFSHAQQQGLYLHFKTQEMENQALLDGGRVGPQRKLYYRELIARFGHHLALNWNMGEEVGPWRGNAFQDTPERLAMAEYFFQHDPYHHHVVIHNGKPFDDILGPAAKYTGVSVQCSWSAAHKRVLHWIEKSDQAGKAWVVANDEQNPPSMGVPPDPGYQGHTGQAVQNGKPYTLHDIRKATLWGTIMAGGAGVEYYFGYKLPQNDLECEDFRSRDATWDYCRIALDFFRQHKVPFWEMTNADARIGNVKHDNRKYCLAESGRVYLIYLPDGGTTEIDLRDTRGTFTVRWFDPRHGGALQQGSVNQVQGGVQATLGAPPKDATSDWLAVVRRR